MKPAGKMRLIVLIAVFLIAIGIVLRLLISKPKEEALPNPNGYDDFVSAGQMLPEKVPDDTNTPLEVCRNFISTNLAALNKGRGGISRPCQVPTEYSTTWLDRHMIQMMATRQLANAFCMEGHLAQLEQRPADAAADYMNAIQMGAVLAHGGLMIDGLIATACEGTGEHFLDADIEHLNAEQSRKLVAELEEVEANQEPASRILTHENRWVAAQMKTFSGLRSYFGEMVERRSLNPDKQDQLDFEKQYDVRLRWAVELKAKLAAHAYALDMKRSPTNWAELIPAYLKQVPNVSFSPMVTNRLKFEETNEALHFY